MSAIHLVGNVPWKELTLKEILTFGFPRTDLAPEVRAWRRKNLGNLWRRAQKIIMGRVFKIPHFYGSLYCVKINRETGEILDFGLSSMAVITTAGVGYLVDALQNLTEPENFKFHGYGTGVNAEAVGDTTLQTELTTQYAVDNTRPTGSQVEAAANIYRSVATLSPDTGGTIAITEHGLFSAASAGSLLDRSVFAAINLIAGTDSLQTTYDYTMSNGG